MRKKQIQKELQARIKESFLPNEKQRRCAVMYIRPIHSADDYRTQERVCHEYLEREDIKRLTTFSDTYQYVTEQSILESPGFNNLLEFCEDNKVDILVVARRDRLGTSTAEYLRCKLDLERLGVEIHAATEIEPVDSPTETLRCILLDDENHI